MNNARLILRVTQREAEALLDLIEMHLDMQAGGMLSDLIMDSNKYDSVQDKHRLQGDAINGVINLSVLQGRILQMMGK
jgi:hypothetical protein